MNRLKCITALLTILFLQAGVTIVTAQTGIAQFLTIDKQSIGIKNLTLVDSTGAGNKIIHTAAFDIAIDNSKEISTVLSLLQNSLKYNKPGDIYFTKTGVQPGRAIDERKYQGSIVREIKLPAITATAKELYIIRVSILAETVSINYDVPTALVSGKERTKALASNFRITLESLPTRRISKVESMKISSDSKNAGGQQFSVELIALDERAWNEVYNNGAGKVLAKGRIEMLSPNLVDVLLTINLEECTITSYRSITGTGQTIAKVAYGIQVGKVSFEIK